MIIFSKIIKQFDFEITLTLMADFEFIHKFNSTIIPDLNI